MITISIIVPIYNCEQYLRLCLDSILRQTLRDFELILVDDGSTDSSYNICEEYLNKDRRIKLLTQENMGAWSARNTGLKIANGNYIGFVDADDYIVETMFEKLYTAITKVNAEIAMCQAISHDNGGRVSYSYNSFDSGELLDKDIIKNEVLPLMIAPEKENEIGKKLLLPMWCRIFKKELLINNQIKFRNHKNGQDALFSIEATCKANSMVIIDEFLYHYRNDIGITLSKGYTEDRYDRLIALKNDIIKVIKENGIYSNSIEKRINQSKRHNVFWVARVIVSKGNNQSFFEKMKSLNNLLKRNEAKQAFSDVNLSMLPIQHKALYIMMKYRCSLFLQIAIKWKFKI